MTVVSTALAVAVMAACTSASDEPRVPDVTAPRADDGVESACAASANALCAKVEACSPFLLRQRYDDRAACERDVVGACRARYRGEAASRTPATCDAAELTCDRVKGAFAYDLGIRWFGQLLIDLCPVAQGTRREGERCDGDGDCETGACIAGEGSVGLCGACAPRNGPGARCTRDVSCADGLACVGSPFTEERRCRALARVGEACSDDVRCEGDDISTKCRGGFCVARADAEGAECGDGTAGCDLGIGLLCSGDGTCARPRIAGGGESCDQVWFVTGADACDGRHSCSLTPSCTPAGRLREPCGEGAACADAFTCTGGLCRPRGEAACAR